MRGNKPHLIVLSEEDRTQLQKIVRDGRTEQRVTRRARVLLAMENEQTIVQDLADKLDLTSRAIRYVCDRYQGEELKPFTTRIGLDDHQDFLHLPE